MHSLKLLPLFALLIAAGISGCATFEPAQPAGMTLNQMHYRKTHPFSVQITVSGGQATLSNAPSQISNQAFAQALTASIMETRLFSQVVSDNRARYSLKVKLYPLDQPSTGFSMTVRIRADWTLSDTGNDRVIWKQAIPSTHTASVVSSRKAVTRIRLATEGAARANIEKGLARISALDLR